ncbi:TIGR02680 family protein [Paenibacillus sp. YYML68]|uniref:TIGR02680 family protein n=1 Tax=Paenibacillus sp. YYML68 TaxID=2909250 RepID=UPI00249165E3|nr:TIGR02680 family protein [Paenibacillus sp. YYML68]
MDSYIHEETAAQAVQEEQKERNRWQMNRAGILNFWFYEEEEFGLEEGRLVLRGTNGAGKSVTMQSFVPLVLDGDKRPHRLDPFGSKDRKIEYYLLGDKEEHSDRTGYLWLEFYHPGKGIYKTIGIGLRARRGMAQVGFWGFVLEDGRRINHDFWLYDRVLELEGQGKYPLDRKTLEERIGAGGQVVQEQRAYRDLVNRSLFGYYDKEAYTDLLQLLVQLRSPKLSKDVKPTAIYDILVQALPPLQEEELRPLSEVMEDMDQLSDRLEELKLHRNELEKLNRSYEQYNRFLLYQSGEQLLAASAEQETVQRQLSSLSKELDGALQGETDAQQQQQAVREQQLEVETELELLGRSEAMEKQKELEQAEQQHRDTEQYADQAQKRLTAALRSCENAELAAEKARKLQGELLEQQREGLEELEGLAGDIEFGYHGVYAKYWSPDPPEDVAFAAAWRKDAETHRSELQAAIRLAEQEREAGVLVAEYDKQLGAMRAERDQAERHMRDSEEASESALHAWKERMLEWKQSLRQLQLSEQAVQAMFAASSGLSYEQQAVDAVLQPAREAAEQQRQELTTARLELQQQVKLLEAELSALAAEKRAWEQSREPEPARTEARARTRSRYAPGYGAPLYEVCEFHAHIGSEQQASIEYALLQSGILDAWIRPDGQQAAVQLQGDAEEVWITAQPLDWGYTLADMLKPLPSPECGLTGQQIEAVLRSFAWGESYSPQTVATDAAAMVVGRDYYQLGAVVGKVDGTAHQAQYIGKEARKRFKQAEIARLVQEMQRCEAELASLRERIGEVEAKAAAVQSELAAFPIKDSYHEALRKAWGVQYEATARFRLLLEQENRMAEQLRSKEQHWSQLKQALIAACADWSRLKTLRDLQEAVQSLAAYMDGVSTLISDWREYRQKAEEAKRYEDEAKSHAEVVELEEENRDTLLEKLLSLRVKVDQLRKLMEELGISDLHARISGLKDRRVALQTAQKQLADDLVALAKRVGVLQERKAALSTQVQEASDKLARRVRLFSEEWRLQLVPEVMGQTLGDERAEWLSACKAIVAQLEPSASRQNRERLSGVLQDQYNAAKHLLGEYVLEQEISEYGRITLMSLRDRTRPQKPAALLAEMSDILTEQENLLSEKDRELFEEIILRSVGKSIRQRIQRAELWMKTMNRLMAERDTSSGLKLQLQWLPKAAQSESELNSDELVALLRKDAHLLHDDEVERLVGHFRSRVQWAKQGAAEEREALRKHIYDMLDYRSWFQFSLRYKKGEETQYRELTDARFNVLSGGEKAMSMYIPLFAATYSRYADASPDAPKIISLDEAFAGVDDENIRDLFGLLTEMDFDYMMTSQVLWGCYDTVPKLGICEIYRPKDASYVTVFRYRWNGRRLESIAAAAEGADAQ